MMRYNQFGHTGVDVSVLGFGAAPVGYLHVEYERTAKILNTLLDRGINVIDTAAAYPGSEDAIGRAVHHRRNDFVLISKCGGKLEGFGAPAWSAKLIELTVDRSLGLLQTDHLDVMLLHSCPLDVLKEGEAIQALADARHRGKVRFIGYSGDNEAAAWAAEQDEIDVIETSVNLVDQANIDKVLPICRRRNLGVIAKRPIANAAWKEPSQQEGVYVEYAREYHERLKTMKLTPADLGFDGEAGESWPEIALRFTLSIEGVHTAIIGTTKLEHLESNLAAVEKGPLPDDVVKKIRDRFAEVQKDWKGLT